MTALFQKKDGNVKQIPPFKPLSSGESTPEGTPEKSRDHQAAVKEKKVFFLICFDCKYYVLSPIPNDGLILRLGIYLK